MESASLLNWSFRLFRVFALEVRVHWSWFLLPALALMWAIRDGMHWWWLPFTVVVPFASILAHEFGHSFMARLVGGDSQLIVMWAMGGLASCEIPATPGRRFAVAAAGPLVSFVIFAICALVVNQGLAPDPGAVLVARGELLSLVSYTAALNLGLLLFNLLPAHPLDGGAMLRAALWPVLGLRRAIMATIVIAYVIIAGMAVWAVTRGDLVVLAIALLLLAKVVQEHVAMLRGFDPYLGQADDFDTQGRPLLESWMARCRERRREKDEKATAAEQRILDTLLAKVSQHGLPALSEQERATLQRISKHQRARQTTGS